MHFSPLLLHTPGLFFSPAVFVLSLPPVIAGSPLLIVIPRFFFFFVIPQLFFFFVIPRLDRGICKGDVRLKAEHDRKRKEAEHDKENTRHGLTICTQKASRFNKGSLRSQCRGQAGYSLRASTKVRAATSERSRASPCQAGYSLRYTFF